MGIYYFKWNGESFSKQIIDYGPIRQAYRMRHPSSPLPTCAAPARLDLGCARQGWSVRVFQ